MNKRDSYADLGLIIAIAVLICMLIKSLLFGITWGSIAWLTISAVYVVLSCRFDSHSRVMHHGTTVYLVLSVIVAVSAVMFDEIAQPKMHAFEGEEKIEESITEAEVVANDNEGTEKQPVDTASLIAEPTDTTTTDTTSVMDINPTIEETFDADSTLLKTEL